MISDLISTIKGEFSGYNINSLRCDLLSGLTVAAVALPLSLAFGAASGLTAGAGLVTAIISSFIIGVLSGGFYQISGPTGTMCAILAAVCLQYSPQGVFMVTLIAGIIRLLCGILHLGKLTAFIPAPVITGFTSGIAIIIASSQIDNFFGSVSQGGGLLDKIEYYITNGFSVQLPTMIIGLSVVLFMIFYPKKFNAKLPGSLVAIILATLCTALLGVNTPQVGDIPKGLLLAQRLDLLHFDYSILPNLIAPAFSIAMLGMIETLLCGSTAGHMTGVKLNGNLELVAQGVGNIALPFFGGIPATAALARTSVAVKSGAKTRLAGIFQAIWLMAAMFLFAPAMGRIPLSALAGVLMITSWRMNEWDNINYIFSKKFKGGIMKFLITMVATIVFDLTWAIVLGVVFSLFLLVSRLSTLQINYAPVDISKLKSPAPDTDNRFKNAIVAYITGSIIFANTDAVEEIEKETAGYDTLVLSMRGASHMDVSGAQNLLEQIKRMQSQGISVYFCGVPDGTMEMINRSGITDIVGQDHFFWSVLELLKSGQPTP